MLAAWDQIDELVPSLGRHEEAPAGFLSLALTAIDRWTG